jgi:ppGpp synthetase/RelA/SpoT-type nucleotidyltranferase
VIERVHLGWRIPEDVWATFEDYVVEKHGTTAEYLRFELEAAMREYLDEDDLLHEAEDLLREYTDLQGLSS